VTEDGQLSNIMRCQMSHLSILDGFVLVDRVAPAMGEREQRGQY